MVPIACCLQLPAMPCYENMELHAVHGLPLHPCLCMYDDEVHCMDAELGAVNAHELRAKSSVGYWYRVCSSMCEQ